MTCACWPCILVREQERQKNAPNTQPIEMICASLTDKKFFKLQPEFQPPLVLPLAREAVKRWFEPRRSLRERLAGA
jgi:hypothetical protein